MATLLNNIPNNITEYPNSFKRQGAFPLERYSVFSSYAEAKDYAENNKIAYVTQPIGVAYKIGEKVVADYYIIGDEKGTLIHIGNSGHNLDEINTRLEEIEQFFTLEDGESLKDTLDELIELQKWIEEHLGDFDEFKEQVKKDLETETARAKEAESSLGSALNKEIQLREAQINGLNFSTKEEVNRAKGAEKELSEKLIAEESRASSVEQSLNNKINEEIQLREAQVNGLNFSLKEEINRAKEDEKLLDNRITIESSRALAAEEVIERALKEETGRAQEAETALGNRIDALTEKTVYLSEDLYAYTNIGLVEASVTNRQLIGAKNDSLKTVFDNVFGIQQDVEPDVLNNSALAVSQTSISAGGGEYGTTVSSADATITFTLNNSGTTSYGYRCGDTKTTGSKTFYYAISPFVVDEKNNIKADIKIVLPSGMTINNFTLSKGSLVSSNGNTLYCNLVDKEVSIETTLAKGSVDIEEQIRLEAITGYVNLGAPYTSEGEKIDSFLTFLENDAAIAPQDGGEVSKSSSQYKITTGSKYVYWATTKSEDAPTSTGWTRYDSGQSSVVDLQLSCAANEYIWVATIADKISFYAWNDASGKYNTTATPTTKSNTTITLINKQSTEADGYYTYRTSKMLQAVNTKFKLA